MKRTILLLAALALLLTACGAPEAAAPQTDYTPKVTVTNGTIEKAYTADDLQALGAAEAPFNGVTYVGVPLSVVLEDAGIDLGAITSVKAVASDGFAATYDASIFLAENTLVAYATADGDLSKDDGNFRMVVPDQTGSMNPRMLVRLVPAP